MWFCDPRWYEYTTAQQGHTHSFPEATVGLSKKLSMLRTHESACADTEAVFRQLAAAVLTGCDRMSIGINTYADSPKFNNVYRDVHFVFECSGLCQVTVEILVT